MKKLLLTLLTLFFAYYCAYITSGASEKQSLFGFEGSGGMYKFICAITGETDTTDADDLYYRGENYFFNQQYDLVIADMNRVLTLDSNYSQAILLIAKAYTGLGDTVSAIESYLKFTKKAGYPADGFIELGHIFKSKGLIDSSYYYYKKAYEGIESYPILDFYIAQYYYAKQDFNLALEHINKALSEDDNVLDYRNLRRNIHLKLGNADLAKDDYLYIISNNSSYFGNYKESAELEKSKNNFQGAVEYYKLALQEQPDERDLLEAKAWVYHSLGKYDSASIDFRRTTELYPDYLSYFNLAYTLDILNQVKESIENYNKSIELKPDYYLSYNNRGYEHYRLKDFKKAEADYTKSIELKDDYFLNHYNRGLLYYELKKYQKAIDDYKNALKYAEDGININYSLALAYDEQKNKENAVYHFNEFIKLAGESDSSRISYATKRILELNK